MCFTKLIAYLIVINLTSVFWFLEALQQEYWNFDFNEGDTVVSVSWKADLESLDWVVLVVCAVLGTLNHKNLDQAVKLNESSAKYQIQMQRSFCLHFKDGSFIEIKLNKITKNPTTLTKKTKKNNQTKKTPSHKNNPENQLCTLSPTHCCWFTVLLCSEVFLLNHTFVLL